jgi:hypothetical protein
MATSKTNGKSKRPTNRFVLPPQDGAVAPFPRAEFERFCSYSKIRSRDFVGAIDFKFLGTQTYIIDELEAGLSEGIWSFNFLKARQVGASQIFKMVDFFYAFKHSGLLGTFILHEEKALDKWRDDLELVYESMPKFITRDGKKVRFKPDIVKHNRNILVFSNGSIFSYLTAGTSDTKAGGLGRSQASNFVHGTETAFYGNEEDLREFQSSVSDMFPYRLQVHESTANAFNHFYDRYKDGQTSKTVRSVFVGWWRDERKLFHVRDGRFNHFGMDRLSRLETAKVRAVKQQYGIDISMQQIAWYRWKLTDEFQGDQTKMDQEFPFTDDEAFQSSGSKYFTAPVLKDVILEARKYPMQAFKYRMTRKFEDTHVDGPLNDARADLKIWEHASKFGVYVLSCDPAYGSSDQADNGCIQVWRCFAECMVQVAEFCSREASEHQLAWIIAHLAGFYGQRDCRVMMEINGAGKSVFAELEHVRARLREMPSGGETHELKNCLNNMKYFYYSRMDTMGGELAYHMVTTEDIKRFLMSGFKSAVELNRMYIRSVGLIDEMRTLINEDGSIAADGGKNDDRVMAAAMAHECWRKWLWGSLRGEGLTRARSAEIEHRGGEKPIDRLVQNYLKTCNIVVPT